MSQRREHPSDPGLNIYSDGEEEEGEEFTSLFAEGQKCDDCRAEPGRVGIDPTCRGTYTGGGEPMLYGLRCLPHGMKKAFADVEGTAVLVEPLEGYSGLYYYRIDEMPAYSFVREDIEGVSWLLLAVGGECARCGEQSHFAWLARESVDPRMPEGEPIFSGLENGAENLCKDCAAIALTDACVSLDLPLMTVEVPRSAMGILAPTGD